MSASGSGETGLEKKVEETTVSGGEKKAGKKKKKEVVSRLHLFGGSNGTLKTPLPF